MKVVLHVGAHRTATSTFQHYLGENALRLRARRIHAVGPQQTRDGLLTGIVPLANSGEPAAQLDYATTRLTLYRSRLASDDMAHLVISDENIAGAARRNLRMRGLYPDLGERLARFFIAFDGHIDRVVLSIRSQESLWASVLAFSVARGHCLPEPDLLAALARSQRSWRDVVLDLACALPGVEIQVMPYEIFGGLPERVLEHMTGLENMPRLHARDWIAKAPTCERLRQIVATQGGDLHALLEGTGRWQPFGADHVAAMRETYADDLFWLRSGAEGLARIVEETGPVRTAERAAPGLTIRGLSDGTQKRSLA